MRLSSRFGRSRESGELLKERKQDVFLPGRRDGRNLKVLFDRGSLLMIRLKDISYAAESKIWEVNSIRGNVAGPRRFRSSWARVTGAVREQAILRVSRRVCGGKPAFLTAGR